MKPALITGEQQGIGFDQITVALALGQMQFAAEAVIPVDGDLSTQRL